jgi:hypothetical protein
MDIQRNGLSVKHPFSEIDLAKSPDTINFNNKNHSGFLIDS